uniref:ATP-dependent DNA helicase n=1 Tax=Acrobeloides nanus TaxID=290746 RepID=A0A914E7F8_9BILA
MLLRNLNPTRGLCNGTRTRLIVKRFHDNLLECEILIGEKKGDCVFIPRISCTIEEGRFPCVCEAQERELDAKCSMERSVKQKPLSYYYISFAIFYLGICWVYCYDWTPIGARSTSYEPRFRQNQLYEYLQAHLELPAEGYLRNSRTEKRHLKAALRNFTAYDLLYKNGIVNRTENVIKSDFVRIL